MLVILEELLQESLDPRPSGLKDSRLPFKRAHFEKSKELLPRHDSIEGSIEAQCHRAGRKSLSWLAVACETRIRPTFGARYR